MKPLIALLVMSAFFTTAEEIRAEVQRITVPEFLDDRPVWVYLPPGYDEDTERRYPVLYMMDGQTVFVDTTNPEGGWKVDESLDELIPAGKVAPLIVVAVANGGDHRTKEYTPHVFGKFGSFSPTTRWAGGRVRDMVSKMVKPDIIIYMDMGTLESGAFQDKERTGSPIRLTVCGSCWGFSRNKDLSRARTC